MGQHKSNPNCQLAKAGMLPPKKVYMSKREAEYRLQWEIYKRIALKTGIVIGPDGQY